MKQTYTENRIVSCYESNANHLLRPAAMLDMMQEAAGRDADTMGFGYEKMISSNTAWVLSRVKLVFHQYPKWRDNVVFKTWHKGANRIFYLRDFLMEDPQGNRLISATTSWLIIDLASRRMVRDRELADNFDNSQAGYAIEEQAEKVTLPKEIEPELVDTHKVVWSDIDTNGHVNNVKYVVWALDVLDYDLVSKNPINELLVNFDSEVLPGQSVDLYRVVEEVEGATVCYIQGKVEGKASFSVKIIF